MKKIKLKRVGKAGSVVQQLDEARFTIDYRNRLNPAQYDAAAAVEGVYLIIAGAGTGKTRTLVYRVARLVELGYDPKSILLLTFTRKAAREMMTRASVLLDDRCSRISGGTFHSFANMTLRKYAKAIGLDPGFTILDQSDSEDVVNLIRNQLGVNKGQKKRFPNKQTLFKIYSLHVNTGRAMEEIIEEDYPHFIEETGKMIEIQKIYTDYKRKNNLLDYDDLLLFLRDFLQEYGPAAKSLLSNINFVMVDEYQDTNSIQSEVVKGLTQMKQNVMVVGDDSQSIYSFRGADFKNIIEFPKLFENTEIIKLEENYRSTQDILEFANAIHAGAIERYDKELFTRKVGGEPPMIVAAVSENLQSKFITERILDLREEGVPLGDIAVLFRSSYYSFDLEIELNKANIPFIKVGGMKFVETAHIKDILSFLRIAMNPKDFVSWYRLLLLHEGIGPKTAQKILDEISTDRVSIKKHPEHFTSKYLDKLFPLFEVLHKLHQGKTTPTEKAQLAMDYYYPIFQTQYDDFNKRRKDLDIFINITENYASLESLISDMAIEPPVDSMIDTGDEDQEEEFVTLSTIHSAKGLEWHSVFIIHALDGFFPSNRSAGKIETLEEERRLMYVAVTRAEKNLFITYPMNMYDRESGTTLSKPSRFLDGITSDLAEGYLLDESALED